VAGAAGVSAGGTGCPLWIDGLLAGRYSRIAAAPAERQANGGPLVLWASQTGNAEEFAARLDGRFGGSQLVNMDDMALAELTGARDVLVITSTFGDGGPPDNGAGFWDPPSIRPTRPRWTASGTRCWASGTVIRQLLRPREGESTAGSQLLARRGCWNSPSVRPTTTSRWTGGPNRSPPSSAQRPSRSRPTAVGGGRRDHCQAHHGGRAVHPCQAAPGAVVTQRSC